MIQQFKTIYPASPLLSQYIYCYYTIDSTASDFKSVHYSLPHTYNALSIYSSAAFELTHTTLKATGSAAAAPLCILQGKRQQPLLVDLEGVFKRITIIFKPLGLNQFIDVPLGSIMGQNPAVFSLWNSPAFSETLHGLFNSESISAQLPYLEKFLCNIYQPLDVTQLQQALDLLADFDNERSIEAIAALVGLSLRTFNRLFKLHLGVSPVTHQRIARFRHSLENKLFSEKFKRLTDIGYESNFYDQSYFIKLYNQLSGTNPKSLFNTLEQLGDSNLVFQFIKTKAG